MQRKQRQKQSNNLSTTTHCENRSIGAQLMNRQRNDWETRAIGFVDSIPSWVMFEKFSVMKKFLTFLYIFNKSMINVMNSQY